MALPVELISAALNYCGDFFFTLRTVLLQDRFVAGTADILARKSLDCYSDRNADKSLLYLLVAALRRSE